MKRRCSFHDVRSTDDQQQWNFYAECEEESKEGAVLAPSRRICRVSLLRSSSSAGCDSGRGRRRPSANEFEDGKLSRGKARRRSANDLALDIGELAYILGPTSSPSAEPSMVKSCMRVTSLEESLRSCTFAPNESVIESSQCEAFPVKRPRNNSMTRSVSFLDVEIHEHGRKLGDNPSVSNGPPMTIGWEILSKAKFSVDEFELKRTFERRHCRHLLIPAAIREEILMHVGYTKDEIEVAVRGILLEKVSRRHANLSIEQKTAAKLEKAVDMFELKVKKLLPFKGRRKSDKQNLMDNKVVPRTPLPLAETKRMRHRSQVAKAC